MSRQDREAAGGSGLKPRARAPYRTPTLEVLGSLRASTRGTNGKGADGALGMTMMSDRRTKEDIVAIGRHPLGFGIYRFRFQAGFAEVLGPQRRIGVMADEVAEHCPEAIERGRDGYLRVNYGRLFGQDAQRAPGSAAR